MNEVTAIIKGPVFVVVFNPKSVCGIFFLAALHSTWNFPSQGLNSRALY